MPVALETLRKFVVPEIIFGNGSRHLAGEYCKKFYIHALEAMRLLRDNLPWIQDRPHDMELRENIMLASMEAGLAFSNAVLGAVHAMAHSMGGLLDLPHGKCNALLPEHC